MCFYLKKRILWFNNFSSPDFFRAAVQRLLQQLVVSDSWPEHSIRCVYASVMEKEKNVCSFVMHHCHCEKPLRPHNQLWCSVGVWLSRVWGHRGPPSPSPAMAQDTVSTAASFFIIVSLAFRRRLSKLSGLLVNTAALWRPSSQMLVVNRVTGPLYLLLRLPLPQLDCQTSSLLLGRRRRASLNGLRYCLTWCPGNLRHPCSCFANTTVS